jgi:hypothetical protein
VNRNLTPDERRQMQSDIAKADANDQLRAWVRSAGLLQYMLVPMLVVSTVIALVAKPTRLRILLLVPVLAVVVFATASLWHRRYFSSLGG